MAMPPQSRRAVAAAVLLCLPALASARLTAAGNNVYAGVYSNACNDRSKPMVRFYDDVMTVEQGGKTVTAKPFKVSKNHLGATPPPDFRAAYVGDVKGGDGLVLVIYHNADVKKLKVAGAEYPVVSVCKPHDCEDHNTVLLYDAAQGTVMGKVYEARRGALIGNPPPALASEIEKLWVSEWRRKP